MRACVSQCERARREPTGAGKPASDDFSGWQKSAKKRKPLPLSWVLWSCKRMRLFQVLLVSWRISTSVLSCYDR